jgi:hypothetical protein
MSRSAKSVNWEATKGVDWKQVGITNPLKSQEKARVRQLEYFRVGARFTDAFTGKEVRLPRPPGTKLPPGTTAQDTARETSYWKALEADMRSFSLRRVNNPGALNCGVKWYSPEVLKPDLASMSESQQEWYARTKRNLSLNPMEFHPFASPALGRVARNPAMVVLAEGDAPSRGVVGGAREFAVELNKEILRLREEEAAKPVNEKATDNFPFGGTIYGELARRFWVRVEHVLSAEFKKSYVMRALGPLLGSQ